MADNAQKTPLNRSLMGFGRKLAADALNLVARSLPASVVNVMGSLVQINFEIQSKQQLPGNITVPMLGSQYIRLPIQPGEMGVTLGLDASVVNVSGQLPGAASLAQQGNLTALVWSPVSSVGWATVDPNTLVLIGGPNGIQLVGNVVINGNVIINGTLTNNGVNVGSTHRHGGVATGTGDTGTPI